MKKLLYLLLLTPIIFLTSCSKSGVTPEVDANIEETIVGKTWKLLNTEAGWFHLNDNNTYLTKDYLCDSLEQFGTWELDGSVLIMTYIIGPLEYIVRNDIIDYNDSLVKIQADTSATLDVNILFEIVTADVVIGCMDSTFLNFNPNAECPDTCTNAPVYGCMDANALNYAAAANIDDGSCCYVGGCIDATALNYNTDACQDDSSCCYVAGCIDAIANNYDPSACFDDGSCNYTTYVPDDIFEQRLIDLGLDNVLDDYVLTANINMVTSLNTGGCDGNVSVAIEDLTGIEAFTSLQILDCSGNQLTSLDVSNNTALIELNCSYNPLTSLNVTNNTALIELNCSGDDGEFSTLFMSQLTNLNVSNNTALIELNCRYNPLTSLDVSANIALHTLYCNGNQLTSLDVSNNTALTRLTCQGSTTLTSVDLRNGNNINMTLFYISSHPTFGCVYVDNLDGWGNAIFAPNANLWNACCNWCL